MDEENTPLTALCAICHVGPLKYTCPRCSIHTCSLPCVKQHKTRAPCSGVRDPTAYKRRRDLVCASSIDSDFNFITSLERSLARAEQEQEQGNENGDGGALRVSGASRAKQTDSARLERLVRESGVLWRRAPRGMKRRKENETRVDHGGVMWTVEFLLPDGRRKVGNVLEKSTVREAWEGVVRTAPAQKSLGKRKRGPVVRQAGDDGAPGKKQSAVLEASERQSEGSDAVPKSPSREDAAVDGPQAAESHLDSASLITFENSHFYLLRPNTPSKLKVLKHLQPSDKIVDILRGRTVMEYPTLYVKNEPPDELPAPCMTEERYLQEFGEDVVVPSGDRAASKEEEEQGDEGEEGEITENKDLKQEAADLLHALGDPSKVLSVLQQDVKS
ncbi:uncharacterized protein HMPREF1541_04135 [Cyphellophora europaea CBS 101466]|uniref:Box C/D snoRNA protein 1 n=1 Tax=Cyphellophora europaea (strain CBS 101466) TaxID=1220924 RepID=W2S2K0_CYPE1|nr:uncharacterized protein HMPREF1541_04135 [Cyphellophora europaea CBS 101466]ETN42194.1 hypothetical protein HMPREF1541_04135 [Cyphellophora europaea CBS 101466]